MDYKAVLQECKSRAELYRGSDAVWNLTHEENCITAITDLLARAEEAEAEIKELKQELSDAAKVVKTIQENTLPFYKNRAEAAESAQETLRCTMVEYKARAEKAEKERDGAVADLTFAVNQYRLFTTDIDLCGLCKFDLQPAGENGQTAECPGFYKDNCFEWRGQKEE